ncbi:MAG: hypothetical protein JNM31_07700 [Flavobacteriales bacterium]|nr:hypothetical protein [Flavobacteriales bacterium]
MRRPLLIIQAFLALTALGGGYALIAAPDGSLLQLPRAFMHRTLFPDFFWPGVILFSVLGVGHVAGFGLTLRRTVIASRVALALGLCTLIWIGVQVLMTELFWLQGVIAVLGVAEVVCGQVLRRSPRT